MPPLVVANACQLILHWDFYGQPGASVLGLRNDVGLVINQSVADTLATQVTNAYTSAALAPNLDAQTVLSSVGVRDIRTANQPELLGTFTPIPGTGTGEGITSALACVVTLRTALAGRSFRGRVYISGLAGALTEEQGATVDLPARTACTAFLTAIRTNVAGAFTPAISLAVISRPRPAVIGPPAIPAWPGAVTAVVSEVVRSPIVGTQRRRLPPRP